MTTADTQEWTQARNSFESGDYRRALDILETLHEPPCALAWQYLIASRRLTRDYQGAEKAYLGAVRKYPYDFGVLSERAWLSVAQRKYQDAVTAFDAVIDEIRKANLPPDPSMWLWKIGLLRQTRKFTEAEDAIDRAKEEVGNAPDLDAKKRREALLNFDIEYAWLYFSELRYDAALEQFSQCLDRAKTIDNTTAQETCMQGQIASLRMQGDLTTALEKAKKAVKSMPDSISILNEYGWLLFDMERYADAGEQFEKACGAKNANPSWSINYAWAKAHSGKPGDLNDAEDKCRAVIRVDHQCAEAFACLGLIAFQRKNVDLTSTYLNEAIKIDANSGAVTDLASLNAYLGEFETAEQQLSECLQAAQANAQAHLELGNVFAMTGRLPEASRRFKIVIDLLPGHDIGYRSLASTLIDLNDHAEAEKVLRRGIRALDPIRRWRLHLVLCQLLVCVGDDTADASYYEDAFREAQSALKLHQGHAATHFHAGVALYKMGDYGKAISRFDRCLQLDKDYTEAEINKMRIKAFLKEDASQTRRSTAISILLGAICLSQLVFLWVIYLERGHRISEKTMLVLVPLLLFLIVVAGLIPWLTKFKMTGFEAELSVPTPTTKSSLGPKGMISFGAGAAAPKLS